MRWANYLLMAGLALAPLSIGAALSAQTLREQQEALRDARARSEAARMRSEQMERAAEAALQTAERAAAERVALGARVEQAEADLAAAKVRIALLRREQAAQRAELDSQRLPLMRLAAALQILARRPAELAMAQPQSMDDLVHVRIMLDAALPDVRRRTAALRATIARSTETRRQAEMAASALHEAGNRLSSRKRELASIEARQRGEADRIGGGAALERERAIGLGERARDIVEQMDISRREAEVRSALIALDGPQMLRSRAAASVSAAGAVRGAYRLPVAGPVVAGLGELSEYGYRARGLTIQPAPGAPVVAPAGGTVRYVGSYRSYGRIVIIDHGAGWMSLITGLSTQSVARGEQVNQGQALGTAEARPVMVELRRHGRAMDITALLP